MAAGPKWWVLAIGVVGVSAAVAWTLLIPRSRDSYRFLAGHGVADRAIYGRGSWPASETRLYSWKASWQDVASRAEPELASAGLKLDTTFGVPNSQRWTTTLIDGGPCGKHADLEVLIIPGRGVGASPDYLTVRADHRWVTVLVTNWLDDNWVTAAQTTLFRERP